MQRNPVESSLLRSIGYDAFRKMLEVEFLRGPVYRYFGVEPRQAKALEEAKSIGGHFLAHVKDKYSYRRVEEDEAPEIEA